ncbi:MAG: tRNA uridine-5-carboxymethylaminomethyl(34) synthesis GTPase MnmE, partial [Lachnospiraceae bacterium]
QDTYQSLLLVEKSLDDQMPEDFYSIDLMSAYASLGYIIGEEVGEDLLNEIFSKFCMGK